MFVWKHLLPIQQLCLDAKILDFDRFFLNFVNFYMFLYQIACRGVAKQKFIDGQNYFVFHKIKDHNLKYMFVGYSGVFLYYLVFHCAVL